ncbi:hypothetical protein ACH5RR_007866 [Cinchona calisaya]|uniref:1-phosphatidylinositol-3-phosphate 5-kinase n=1 Tax=Cinchona calisaya TaxID=153742 RepID=A0ABD3ABH3_9GENT
MEKMEKFDAEPVDFENSGVFWLPPEPEDQEAECDEYLFYAGNNDDEGHAAGDLGCPRASISFGNGEFSSRENSNEERKRVLTNVVVGHVRALVAQLLQAENLSVGEEDDKESWLDTIISLSWEAASFLRLDMSEREEMHPRGYVKVECIASGHRSDSVVVKGVVCNKNVVHQRMRSNIEKPRVLFLGGNLEYQRVSNLLPSTDTLLQLEMDHLKMAVAKIDSLNPDVLLVERSVSHYAQEYLLSKNISLVSNIERPVLEHIARCTGGQIAPSVDHLSSVKLGYCNLFHVETFLEEHGTTGQSGKKPGKTLMYFEGCPKPLGSTILLRGTNGDELKKVKHVVQYGVFAAYHLALETSFLADEGASLPELSVTANNVPNDRDTLDKNLSHLDQSSYQLNIKQVFEVPVSSKGELFPSPSDHQSILVALLSKCVWKGTVCEMSHLFRIKYYGNFDKPLGRFLQDCLFDESYTCHSCEMPSEAHVQCYIHQHGILTMSVKKLPEFLLPGQRAGKIWMWHRCLKCPRINGFPPATRRIVMSDAAWGLSFGKFLELSFSSHAAASCGHSLHRDCLRFYGFGKMVACFRYASIDVHSVYLPPSKLNFNFENQEWVQQELNEMVGWAELLFSEVLNALHLVLEKNFSPGLPSSCTDTPESRCQIADLEAKLQEEKAEFEVSLKKILNKEAKKDQPVVDILEINRLHRELLFQSYMWDHRLKYVANLDSIYQNEMAVYSSTPGERPDEEIVGSNVSVKPAHCSDSSNLSPADENHDHGVSGGQDPPEVVCDHGVNVGLNNPPEIVHQEISTGLNPDIEGHGEDLAGSKKTKITPTSPFFPSRNSENMEDSDCWLCLPFISFYRALNKNFLGNNQKLNSLCECNPVYISSFRESELQHGARLLLPVGVNDIVVAVYDDEPTSVISYALASPDYIVQLSDDLERPKEMADSSLLHQSIDSGNFQSFHSKDKIASDSYRSLGYADESILSMSNTHSRSVLDPLSYTKAMHATVSFTDDGPLGKVKYTVTCYYARRFEALRRICCPSDMDFIRSLCRCMKWGAQSGKNNAFSAKTMDDRFIIKQVTKTELESFIKFAPAYFKYLSESIGSGSPTCLAKILGIYQVMSKHFKGGKELKMDVLVMENVMFGRNLTRIYDLKGSSRFRYNQDSSGSNKVLLDQNLIEAVATSPIFVGSKARRLLERAVWNDTTFLQSIDATDYSLLVGVDQEKHELVVGFIDFMRQYTWDKQLVNWVESSGILGGPKSASPTVISPREYKKRFRRAISTYFMMVPDQRSQPTIVPSRSQTDSSEENLQGVVAAE